MRFKWYNTTFKVLNRDKNDFYCKFTVRPPFIHILTVGTICKFKDGRQGEIVQLEISNNMYSANISGSCVLRLIPKLSIYDTPVFYN